MVNKTMQDSISLRAYNNANGVWEVPDNLDTSNFDFNWRPEKYDKPYIHQFGTQWQKTGGPRYIVSGATEIKYVSTQRAIKLSDPHKFEIKSDLKCDFDFSWHHDETEPPFIYAWGTEWLNAEVQPTIVYRAPDSKSFKYMGNNVTLFLPEEPLDFEILYIEHKNVPPKHLDIENRASKVYREKYNKSYLITIRSWLKKYKNSLKTKNHYLWILSNVCDYDGFDFSFYPDKCFHVFGSKYKNDIQKFGDTFFVDISCFTKKINLVTKLEDLTDINFNNSVTFERLQHPIINHNYDTHVEALKLLKKSSFPYVELFSKNNSLENITCLPLNLWVEENQPIISKATGATNIVLPINSLSIIKNQLYDYPHILELSEMGKSKNLDIVFISNGESIAEENYLHLCDVLTKNNITNRVVRVKNVNGRLESQYAAANASETDWYFLINGKLRVDENFDWSWQPDRLQQQKHYIFMAKNPVNGLVYGHQAIVANNKHLTLTTVKTGLDFTMDSLHAVVEKMSGTALYNTDQWTTWRTAFREAIKLKNSNDYISKFRLSKWCEDGQGDFAEWSQRGALDGVEYWEKVGGDLEELLHSYDWDWIHKYYNKKYGN